jgi:hypothetical protein
MIEELIEDAPLPEWTSQNSRPTQELTEAEQEDHENDALSQHFGSDDEDYDQLFMECTTMDNQNYQQQPQSSGFSFADMDAMDTEMTDC